MRFQGLPRFPTAKPAANEMASAFQRHCLSDEHARQTATDLIDSCKFCPTPAEVRQAALDNRDDFLPKWKGGCKKCGGMGYVMQWCLITWSHNHQHKAIEHITAEQAANLRGKLTVTQSVAEMARRCDCLEELISQIPPEPETKRGRRSGQMRAAGDVEWGAA